ncbi:MAG TPA: hypothetical protein VN729_06235 [Ktedonobacteraceae bacterium]|nr:hypothetical protein [Ktedonobacteraceae bacterium]
MTNGVIENPTDIRTDQQCILIGMSLEESRFATVPVQAARVQWTHQSASEENRFATVPMLAIRPAREQQRQQEEEWHTSFEQAISERAARVSQQLRRLSTTGLDLAVPVTDPLPSAVRPILARARQYWQERKRTIALCCLAFLLILVGFDLMGLLVMLR